MRRTTVATITIDGRVYIEVSDLAHVLHGDKDTFEDDILYKGSEVKRVYKECIDQLINIGR